MNADARWLMGLLAVILSACAAQPPTNYYSLQVQADENLEVQVPERTNLGVGPLSLPSELDRPSLLTETANGGVKVANYHIWAGELEENTARVLSGLMAEHLGIHRVYTAPWDTRFRPEHQLRVDIQRFSGQLGGVVTLEVLWTVSGNSGRQLLSSRRSRYEVNAANDSYLAYVNAMSQLLSQLSAEVAVELEKLLASNS